MSREAALKSNPLVSVGLTGDSLSAKVPIECIYVAVYVCMYACLPMPFKYMLCICICLRIFSTELIKTFNMYVQVHEVPGNVCTICRTETSTISTQ